jgi:hypothetical protein
MNYRALVPHVLALAMMIASVASVASAPVWIPGITSTLLVAALSVVVVLRRNTQKRPKIGGIYSVGFLVSMVLSWHLGNMVGKVLGVSLVIVAACMVIRQDERSVFGLKAGSPPNPTAP